MENDAQFKCPQCGSDCGFWADAVVLYNAHVDITPEGWDYWSANANVDLAEGANLTCKECGYTSPAVNFAL